MASKTILIKLSISLHNRIVNSDTTISKYLNKPKGYALTQRKQNIMNILACLLMRVGKNHLFPDWLWVVFWRKIVFCPNKHWNVLCLGQKQCIRYLWLMFPTPSVMKLLFKVGHVLNKKDHNDYNYNKTIINVSLHKVYDFKILSWILQNWRISQNINRH